MCRRRARKSTSTRTASSSVRRSGSSSSACRVEAYLAEESSKSSTGRSSRSSQRARRRRRGGWHLHGCGAASSHSSCASPDAVGSGRTEAVQLQGLAWLKTRYRGEHPPGIFFIILKCHKSAECVTIPPLSQERERDCSWQNTTYPVRELHLAQTCLSLSLSLSL